MPVEPELLHGVSLVPDENVWVVAVQAGRTNFFDGPAHSSADLRRIGVTVAPDRPHPRWGVFPLYPSVGAILTLQNRAPLAKTVRGAFLVEALPFPPARMAGITR